MNKTEWSVKTRTVKTRTDACDKIKAKMKTHPTPDDMSPGAY